MARPVDLFDLADIPLAPSRPSWQAETIFLRTLGGSPIAGLDEVGRGPLAGPVVAAAVILDPDNLPDGLADSKRLSASQRQQLSTEIKNCALAWHVAQASVTEIDDLNILQASLLAMRRACEGLAARPLGCLVDGNQDPGLGLPTQCLVKGDGRSLSIAAASIIAKVFRDALMADLDKRFPAYGWATNAGYGVKAHLEALDLVGPSPHHRKSFAPIARLISQSRPVNS